MLQQYKRDVSGSCFLNDSLSHTSDTQRLYCIELNPRGQTFISGPGSWSTAYGHTITRPPRLKALAASCVRSSGLVAAIANNNALAIMNAYDAVEQYLQAVDVAGDAYHLSASARDVDNSGSEDDTVPGLGVEEAAVQANDAPAAPGLDCSEVLLHIDVPEGQDQQEVFLLQPLVQHTVSMKVYSGVHPSTSDHCRCTYPKALITHTHHPCSDSVQPPIDSDDPWRYC